MIYFRILLHAFFLLPATLLHEIAHAAIAAIFGKVASFSIIPQISQQTLVFGSVPQLRDIEYCSFLSQWLHLYGGVYCIIFCKAIFLQQIALQLQHTQYGFWLMQESYRGKI